MTTSTDAAGTPVPHQDGEGAAGTGRGVLAATATRRSQADLAYHGLRELLVTLQIAPGEPLDEAELMDRLGVGRTPLREARNRLVIDRLLVTHARRGTFATEIELTDLALLTDVRAQLEGLAAERAATRATATDRATLAELVASRPPSDPFAAMRHDSRIHRALWAAAHNHFLEEAAERHHSLSTRIWYVFVDHLHDVDDHVQELAGLVHFVLAGDAAGAARAARDHVRHFEAAVAALLRSDHPPATP